MIRFDVSANVRGTKFQMLIGDLSAQAETIGFVIQGDLLYPNVEQLLQHLAVDKTSDLVHDAWPGTELLSGSARILEYRSRGHVVDALCRFAGGLFDTGKDPALPQDFFMRSRDTVVLETVSHERLAYIRVAETTPFLDTLLAKGIIKLVRAGALK